MDGLPWACGHYIGRPLTFITGRRAGYTEVQGLPGRAFAQTAAMTRDPDTAPRAAVLDPIDRISEVLFGLFMVLTFTGTLSVASAGREDVRQMMVAAIGCNIAWGFVDAVMYVLRNLVSRGHKAAFARAVLAAPRPEQAHALIVEELRGTAEGLGTAELEVLRRWLGSGAAGAEARPRLRGSDLRGALGVFALVVVSTFPPVLPFIFIPDLQTAKRVSAAVAIAMLFFSGYVWGRHAGMPPVKVGLVMVLLGSLIQAVVIALGG